MTMPKERTRAMLWAGSFLVEVARDKSLPLQLRRQAVVIARHFPTIEDIASMAHARDVIGRNALVAPSEVDCGAGDKYGPLTYSTRLSWPEEDR